MAKTKKLCMFVLRLIALGATVSAAIVMATSHDSTRVWNNSFEAKYTDSPTFKFFVIANAIGAAYSLLVLFVPSGSSYRRVIVGLDVIITMLLNSSISAGLAIAYVGKKGNPKAGWLPICGQFPNFCNQVTGAMIAAIAGLIIYLVLVLHSIHTVFDPLCA